MVRKFLFTIIFILLTAFFLYLGVGALFTNYDYEQTAPLPYADQTENLPSHSFDFSQPTPTPLEAEPAAPRLTQTAWIPDWDFTNGYKSFKANAEYFNSVSPVWYYLTPEGDVKTNKVGLSDIRQFTKQRGIKLIPSIASFDADELHSILDDDQKFAQHLNYLKDQIDSNDFDGIDIDYESIYLEDQPEFLQLLRELYNYLDPQGKKLTVAVMPKWNEADIFLWLRQTRDAQDWYEIGQVVHELRIMTYNVTNYDSQFPGPVAPYDWLKATLRYALTKVDPEKIILGLPLYGYDGWSSNLKVPDNYLGIVSSNYTGKGQADAVTYGRVAGLQAPVRSNKLDPDSKEKVLRYTEDGKEYIVYYPDLETTRLRVELAEEMGVGGVAYWRMGDEDTRIYSLINN